MYRDENRDIVYLDESWINKNIAPTHTWLPDEKCESALDIMQNRHVKLPKFSSGKGARLIILHAGSCKTGYSKSFKPTGHTVVHYVVQKYTFRVSVIAVPTGCRRIVHAQTNAGMLRPHVCCKIL